MTSLANTIYGLVLLFVTGSDTDSSLLLSLLLTLLQLLRQMNEEKLKLNQIAQVGSNQPAFQ